MFFAAVIHATFAMGHSNKQKKKTKNSLARSCSLSSFTSLPPRAVSASALSLLCCVESHCFELSFFFSIQLPCCCCCCCAASAPLTYFAAAATLPLHLLAASLLLSSSVAALLQHHVVLKIVCACSCEMLFVLVAAAVALFCFFSFFAY